MIDIRGILSCWSALFDSNKGQMELLQAVKRIVAEGKDILCYLVGPDVGFMPKCQKIYSR